VNGIIVTVKYCLPMTTAANDLRAAGTNIDIRRVVRILLL